MARDSSADRRQILEGFFTDILLNVMVSMIKADSVEPKFAKIKEAAKALTKAEMRRIAAQAAKYYVERANPSPKELSDEEVDELKREALAFALIPPTENDSET
jgi:hypothetical protein